MNPPSIEHLEWWHALVGVGISALAGAAARGPAIAKHVRRSMEELLGRQLSAHVAQLQRNEAEREKGDASRVGGMIALTNLVNDAMGRVEALAVRTEAAESAAAKVIKDFNGLGGRVSRVESRVDALEKAIVK